ncbi:MAG: hypothetical protein J0M34_02575 [Alphaproteobacteria bacterium]|nr:hypothetical protein [Alphaproteobacteria bacterium]
MKKLIALVLVIGVGAYLYLNLGAMVTQTAEKIASGALGVAVNIGSVDVSLSDKKVTVNTIEIANPTGYSKPHAVTAKSIAIGLNTASKQLIDFKDILVKGSVVNLEMNEKGMNLVDLKNLANSKKQKESVGSEQVRVIVQHMVIDASTINPSVSFLKHDIKPITMPAITFSNIGKGGGVKAGDAISHILIKYLSAIEKTARDSGALGDIPILDKIGKNVDDVAKGLKDLF